MLHLFPFVVSPNYLSCLKMWQSGFMWKLQGARALPFLIEGMDWRGKRVVIAGMGAFAVENVQGTQGSKNATLKRHWVLIPTWVHSRWWRIASQPGKGTLKIQKYHYILYDAFYWGVNNLQLEMCILVNFGTWPCRNCNFAWPWAMPVPCSVFLRRTALEHGASEVTVVARRHGTICPKARTQSEQQKWLKKQGLKIA